jgi:hypothetical protein
MDDGSGEVIRAIAASHLSLTYEELRRATDEFNKLGQGGYGTVYKVGHARKKMAGQGG